MRKIEVLAPAGSMESLKAAINAGCDAVYVGGSMFGARAFAANFSEEELIEAIGYVHLYGKQLFLTVNTLLKEEELNEYLYNYLKKPYEAGLDAVIVQDMGVLHFVHQHFPDLPIHCSTQMSLTMANGVNLLKKYGVTRLVTARELSIEEIKEIRNNTDLEIESFVHGALCYCFSGQCLMSSMLGTRSGNRGRCAQPCRMTYELRQKEQVLTEKSSPYLLSPKDICTLSIIGELIESGIDSFKIEGRMKRAEYTALVSHLYRKYIDLYQNLGKEKYQQYLKKHHDEYERDQLMLMDIYNRGSFTTGYYNQHNGKNMMSESRPNHNGVMVGKVTKVMKNQVGITFSEQVNAQDLLEIRGTNHNVYEYTLKDSAKKGEQIISNILPGLKFNNGDAIFRTKNQSMLDSISERFIKQVRKIELEASFVAKEGKPIQLTLVLGDKRVTCYGNIPDAAKKAEATAEGISKQLMKTAETYFTFEPLNITLDGGLFLPNGWLNELRRNAIDTLINEITKSYQRELGKESSYTNIYNSHQKNSAENEKDRSMTLPKMEHTTNNVATCDVNVLVSDREQIRIAMESKEVKAIYLRLDQYTLSEGVLMAKRCSFKDFYLVLPHIFRKETYEQYQKELEHISKEDLDFVTGFIIKNIEEYEFLLSSGLSDKHLKLDYTMYTLNREAKALFKELGVDDFTASVELTEKELKALGCEDSEIVVYGHLPLMITANCLVKNSIGCTKKEAVYHLKDRLNKEFIVKNYCGPCYNVIYNADPLMLLNQSVNILKLQPKSVRLEFTTESGNQMQEIITAFVKGFTKGEKVDFTLSNYTKGHFHRGIE